MLTEEKRLANKEEYIELLNSIVREGTNIPELIDYLEDRGFFDAPASKKYHNSFEGGLVDHSLNVYHNLLNLFNMKYSDTWENFDIDTLKIVALCHDFDKIRKYKKSFKNVKVYCEDGDKWDNLGKFTWVSEESWDINDDGTHLVYGNHEMNSEFITRQFIPLRIEESIAILHHMGTLNYDSAQDNITEIYAKYPVTLLLHQADMLATYIDEVNNK